MQVDGTGGSRAVKDYDGAAVAYADELRKWAVASQCRAVCNQMACMHSYAYAAYAQIRNGPDCHRQASLEKRLDLVEQLQKRRC
ncbi:unnamed protein product [Toxocara canis]|uniref:Apple domain-containing protein n=1 Tax=Toxocara canis TaxID=6265 RepID=A0A183U1T2_TOXCA|nr:unnamed protein product [Toxocara canis]